MPGDEKGTRAGRGAASLEEFLAACQRSLALAAWNAQQVSKSDRGFARGELPLYVIDGLEIELKAGFLLLTDRDSTSRVFVDLDAEASERSTLRFRVESRPLEVEPGAKVEVAELNPLRAADEAAALCAWVQGRERQPLPGHELRIYVAWLGEDEPRSQVSVATDVAGEVRFELRSGRLDILGGESLQLPTRSGGSCWIWVESTITGSEPPDHRRGSLGADGVHDWRSATLRIRAPIGTDHGE